MVKLKKLSELMILILLGLLLGVGTGVYIIYAGTDDWTDYAEMDWYRSQPVDPGFTIHTAEELAGIAVLVNSGEANGFVGKTLMIAGDIDLSGHDWVPIGTETHPFRGTLYASGGNVQIDGLTITGDYRHTGLIGKAVDASIGGLTIANSGEYHISVTDDVYAGSVIGEMDGLTEVYNVVNQLDIVVEAGVHQVYVGGVAGYGEYKLSNATNDADLEVNGHVIAAGVVGVSSSDGLELKKVENHGDIHVDGEETFDVHAGGIVGVTGGLLVMDDEHTPIVNTGTVYVQDGKHSYAGGIIGEIAAESPNYSHNTSNEGHVTIQAPSGASSSAGGLVGAISAPQLKAVSMLFSNEGDVTNHGGEEVHTGGIAGFVQTDWAWTGDSVNDAAIVASGTKNVFTGGIVGKTTATLTFNGMARNTENGIIQVAPDVSSSKPDEAFTGGLIGYAKQQALFEQPSAGAYENKGMIEVTGRSGLYTGGLIANQPYAGNPTDVHSEGNINVRGEDTLYTGGFIGMLTGEAAEYGIEEAVFSGTIEASADTSTSEAMVATGGFIGYYENQSTPASLDELEFRGQLQATGGEYTYTGGIVGYATGALLTHVQTGNTSEAYASITSDGHAGGVAGYVSGTVDAPIISHLSLVITTKDGYAGGVAGIAQGSIHDATVGNAASETMDSVRFQTAITDSPTGEDQFTAGGMVGENDGVLSVEGTSHVDKITLMTAADRSHYTFGGVVGSLTPEGRIGTTGVPVVVKDLSFTVHANSSIIGGAIGRNASTTLYLSTENVQLSAVSDDTLLGGVIGLNTAEMDASTIELSALRPDLHASGDQVWVGSIAGENKGIVLNSTVEDATITAAGTRNAAGGMVGRNTGTLQAMHAINSSIQAQEQSAAVGGIVGRSERAMGAIDDPLIADVRVEQRSMPLMIVNMPLVNAGGIAGYATDTNVTNPVVTAVAPDYVIISVSAPSVSAGGIVGRMENGTIQGDGVQESVSNLLLNLSNGSEDSYAGGIVGYSHHASLDKLVVNTAVLTLHDARTIAGGAAGLHLGTETAIVSNVYLDTISLRAMPNAAEAIVGGVVGHNVQRPSLDPVADATTAVSTLQNNRVIGNLANPNSPVLDIRAPQAIAGGLVGKNDAFIANNSISDRIALSVTGDGSILGGHTGMNGSTGSLYYTYANANITAEGEGTVAGGLVGSNEGKIHASYVDTDLTADAYGTVDAWTPLGGLIGHNKGHIDKSYSVAKVTSNGMYTTVGGLVGIHEAGAISNSYAGQDVAAQGANAYAGGFAGQIVNGTVTNSYSAANVTAVAGSYAGGFAGRYDNEDRSLLTKNYYLKDEAEQLNHDLPDFADGNHRWLNVPARLSTLLASTLSDRDDFPSLSGWDFTNVWRYGSLNSNYLYPELILSPNSGGGDGGSTVNADVAWYTHDPFQLVYEINTEAELSGLAAIVNGTVLGVERFDFSGREIRIMNPIHIQSAEWVPIGASEATPFKGTFEGNGHLIDGYTITAQSNQAYAGLFGVIAVEGRVQHVKLEPLSIAGADISGTLAAVNHGSVTDSEVLLGDDALVSGKTVGGLLGINTGTISALKLLSSSEAQVTVTVEEGTAGGFIGYNTTNITAQTFAEFGYQGTISSEVANAYVGGVIGKQSGDFGGFEVPLLMRLASDGESVIAGGVIGRYERGDMSDLDVLLAGSVEMSGTSSIAAGVIGKSDSDHTLSRISITASQPDAFIRGNGIVGGMIGEKLGKGAGTFDLEALQLSAIEIGSLADSTQSVIGGIVGTLSDSAMHSASFSGKLRPLGEQTTVGGIAGTMSDSVLYEADSVPDVQFTAHAGESVVGGIVGSILASDINKFFDFDRMIPFYVGLYDVKSHDATLHLEGSGASAEVLVGGLVGKNERASIYFSNSTVAIEVSDLRAATAGGLAGESTGNIIQSEASGTLMATNNTSSKIGGVVGIAEGGEMYDTHATSPNGEPITINGTLTRLPTLPEVYAGGFAGILNQVKLTNVTAAVNLEVKSENVEDSLYVGGFVGAMGQNASLANGSLEQAYAKGHVHVDGWTSAFAGGFAGSIDRYAVKDAYATGNVANAGFDTRSGGFAATIERRAVIQDAYALQSSITAKGVNRATRAYVAGFAAYSDGHIEHVHAEASAIELDMTGASAYRGALVGYLFRDGTLTDSTYVAELDAIGYSLGTSDHLMQQPFASTLPSEQHWFLDASFLLNEGDDLVVMNADQLRTSVVLMNETTGLTYLQRFDRGALLKLNSPIKLGADIDLRDLDWTPYESFTQVFDGQNHTVSGLSIANASTENVGFMTDSTGTIKNVQFVAANVSAEETANVGVVVGMLRTGGVIENVDVEGTVTGGAATGLIVGMNKGEVSEATVRGVVGGSTTSGGIAGQNVEGATIHYSEANAEVSGTEMAGGIAGTNNGHILTSFSSNSVQGITAGGIVGANQTHGTIEHVFSYSDVTAKGAIVKAGGIAGTSSGRIVTSYASGRIKVDGEQTAHAGGIVGDVEDGIIQEIMSLGEAAATIQNQIVKGSTYFGGIAGQKQASAVIDTGAFNQQMLRDDVAYYDHEGQRVYGDNAQVAGLSAQALADGTLPDGFDRNEWVSMEGFFPQLKSFIHEPASKLSAAAVILPAEDHINEMTEAFGVTFDPEVSWSSQDVQFTQQEDQLLGHLQGQMAAVITATVQDLSRTIEINEQAPPFAQYAKAPSFVNEPQVFTEDITIELSTGEPDGTIYYTLDGTMPGTDSLIYVEPIIIEQTTTVKAITIVDDLGLSEVTVGTWQNPSTDGGGSTGGSGGGGGGFIPAPVTPEPSTEPIVQLSVSDTEIPVQSDAPVQIVRNSKLTLTVPEGVTVYYTTDGSTPTKQSSIYTGALLITENMSLKLMTGEEDTIVTLEFEVKPASFEIKPNAKQIRYMSGYEDGTFAPDQAITRYEFIHVLAPLLNMEDVPLGTLLTDVDDTEEELVAKFHSAGLITGYPDGTFDGMSGLKRSEVVVILTRMLGLEVSGSDTTTFADMAGHWSSPYVQAFVAAGYLQGYPDGTFRPEQEITRAETAVLLNKLLGKQVSDIETFIQYADLTPEHWAYEHIMAAVRQ